MRIALILVLLGVFNFANANVAATQPTVESATVQAELMDELETVSEDLDFDSEDEIFLSSDDTLIVDPDIEMVTSEKTTKAKVEAKADTKTAPTKKK